MKKLLSIILIAGSITVLGQSPEKTSEEKKTEKAPKSAETVKPKNNNKSEAGKVKIDRAKIMKIKQNKKQAPIARKKSAATKTEEKK
jgi:hypothetical protein